MQKVDPKKYTVQTINTASGKRITEVLKRYWNITGEKKDDAADLVKRIFGA